MELFSCNHKLLEVIDGGVGLETEAHAAVAFCPVMVPDV